MTVNVDTYVLPEDSDSFLSEVLPASDPLRITWEVLEKEEKEGYLEAALRRVESLNFIGDKVHFYQALKFPRIARGLPADFENAPPEIKRAQVLIAADIARENLYIKKRNHEACVALGLARENALASHISEQIDALLHRWVTRWRRV